MIEINSLFKPTENLPPCGPSLEYDGSYQELERAVQGKPEQVIGDHTIPAIPPDWSNVQEMAAALLARSKDLRVAVWLTRAFVHLDHIAGLTAGLQLIEGLLIRYWEEIHPKPDSDDNDLTIRLNALASLGNSDSVLGDLRDATLIQTSSHGRITVREAEIALGRLPNTSNGSTSSAVIEMAIRESSEAGQTVITGIKQSLQSCQSICALVSEHVNDQASPDLTALTGTLNSLLVFSPEVAESDIATEQAISGSSEEPGNLRIFPKTVNSRDEAMRLLDAVCDYLIKVEPTNPAPLLIRRAQRLMTMSFVEIIEELAPDSLAQVKSIAGLDKE